MDRAAIEPLVARSRVQRLNHWAIKVPERPSRVRVARSLHYSSLFWNLSPLAQPTFNQGGELPIRRTRVTAATSVTDRAGIEPRVARSRVKRLNHWAIKVPKRPSLLRVARSLQGNVRFIEDR